MTEITTRTCPNPARQDHSWATICEENIPDCKVLNRAGKNFEKDGCDIDIVYKLSGKNDKGPFPGTCEDYRRWDDQLDECLEAKDCLNYPNVECRNKMCYCGEERFDTDTIGKIGPAKCDGTSGTFYEGVWCEGGHIVPKPIPGEKCTNGTSCVEENGSAICKNVPPPPPPPGK